MTRTQYLTAATLDGFIADEHHSLDWLFTVESGHGDRFPRFFAGVGAFAMGAHTYEWVRRRQTPEDWHRWYGDTPCWVFTHRDLPAIPGVNLTFVSGDVRPVHAAMVEAAAGKNVWLVGGGELVGTFADHGLLDDLLVKVAPVTLGAGAPLLPRRILSTRLRLTGVERDGQTVELHYTVGPPESD